MVIGMILYFIMVEQFNTLRPAQNGWHFVDNIFKCCWIKCLYFNYYYSNFTEVCFQRSNWQHITLGSGNGLAPNRWQAITWTNRDPDTWCCVASLGHNELTHLPLDKMAAISQMAFLNAIPWKKRFRFRWRFHWSVFLRFKLTIFHPWFR